MKKKMFIDASHPEETRVVVTEAENNNLVDLDFELTNRKTLKSNIYLARVVKVEPSLQAAFVDYGSGKHGFLPFSDIHPDYYRIPVADQKQISSQLQTFFEPKEDEEAVTYNEEVIEVDDSLIEESSIEATIGDEDDDDFEPLSDIEPLDEADEKEASDDEVAPKNISAFRRIKLYRNYKIQEVIKKNQLMLVQVVKEERGNKGAALTTYLSLAGRYCVLMPNAGRGGGVSRKIIDAGDRKRLKKVIETIGVPEGMAVIVRTAGMERTKTEIKRDLDYLLKLWNDLRADVLNSEAPKLVYEEANIVKRALRDMYDKNTEEVLISGKESYQVAKAFIRRMIPSHARRVQLYREPTVPLFHKYELEYQLNNIFKNIATLKSGGYLVINPTEALTAVDVNSGRSTKERHINETALKTNLEAAEEVARQLRLRDLGGLVVIDFIDMEDNSHVQAVERKMREVLKQDRARVQVGRISNFGLMELSRQRLRPSLLEISTHTCEHCSGLGYIRTVESAALYVLRSIETFLLRVDRRPKKMKVNIAPPIALYIFNHKRAELLEIETKYDLQILLDGDVNIRIPEYKIEVLDHSNKKNEVQLPAKSAPKETPRKKAKDEKQQEEQAGKKANRKDRNRRKKKTNEPTPETKLEEKPQQEAKAVEKAEEPKRRRRRKRKTEDRTKVVAEAPVVENEVPAVIETTEEATKPVKRKRTSRKKRNEKAASVEENANKQEASKNEKKAPEKQKKEKEVEPVGVDKIISEPMVMEDATAGGGSAPVKKGWWKRILE